MAGMKTRATGATLIVPAFVVPPSAFALGADGGRSRMVGPDLSSTGH